MSAWEGELLITIIYQKVMIKASYVIFVLEGNIRNMNALKHVLSEVLASSKRNAGRILLFAFGLAIVLTVFSEYILK